MLGVQVDILDIHLYTGRYLRYTFGNWVVMLGKLLEFTGIFFILKLLHDTDTNQEYFKKGWKFFY